MEKEYTPEEYRKLYQELVNLRQTVNQASEKAHQRLWPLLMKMEKEFHDAVVVYPIKENDNIIQKGRR